VSGDGVRSSLLVSSTPTSPPLSALVSDPKDAAGIARAYLEHRYTQQEIADHLGVHYSTISRRLRSSCVPRMRNTMRDCKT
jgi:DNA-directed RNA polymerase specialized sigma24 family protein